MVDSFRHILDLVLDVSFNAAKPSPPSDVKVISEKAFPTSLLINWSRPIAEEYFKLTYEIRFCQHGSQSWSYVSMLLSMCAPQTLQYMYDHLVVNRLQQLLVSSYLMFAHSCALVESKQLRHC